MKFGIWFVVFVIGGFVLVYLCVLSVWQYLDFLVFQRMLNGDFSGFQVEIV